MKAIRTWFFQGLWVLGICSSAFAAQNVSQIGYIYPAGGCRGTSFRVVIGGTDLDGVSGVHVSGEGVSFAVESYFRPVNQGAFKTMQSALQILRDRQRAGEELTPEELLRMADLEQGVASFQIRKTSVAALVETVYLRATIAPDAPPGNVEIRLETDLGISNPLEFQIGELPEVSELSVREYVMQRAIEAERTAGQLSESDDKVLPGTEPVSTAPETPTDVSLPCCLNGQIPPGDFDLYRFQAQAGQKLVFDIKARRLVPYVSDGVPGWFQAVATLYDDAGNVVAYSDDHLTHPDPVLYYEVPTDGAYVLEIKDALYRGRESFVYRADISERPFVTGVFPLGAPVNSAVTLHLEGWNLPVHTLDIQASTEPGRYAVATNFCTFHPEGMPFAVSDSPEILETEPNGNTALANNSILSYPVVINGRIGESGDVDVFAFHFEAGQELSIDIEARRLGSPLDAVVKLTDTLGRQIAFSDDVLDNAEGLINHHADPRLVLTIPETGAYYLHVADAQHRGGSLYAYRAVLRPRYPDFALRATPASISVHPGHTEMFTVHAIRYGGMTNDILIEAVGLPAGSSLSGGIIPAGASAAVMTLSTPANAPAGVTPMGLRGSAETGGRTIVRPVIPADDQMQAFYYRHLVPFDDLMVSLWGDNHGYFATVTSPVPLRIPLGGTLSVKAAIPNNSYYGAIDLMMASAPPGIKIDSYTLNPLYCEFLLRCDASICHVGQRGNVVVDVISVKDSGIVNGREQRIPEYIRLCALPALPLEIVGGENLHRIVTTSEGNGTVYPTNVTVTTGGEQIVRFAADRWHHIGALDLDGSPVRATRNSYTLTGISSDHVLHVVFAPNLVGEHGTPAPWLAGYGITQNQEAAVLDDLDGDGHATWQEYIIGSDPTNAASGLFIEKIEVGSNTMSLRWPSVAGRLYSLMGSPFMTSEFNVVMADIPATPPANTHTSVAPVSGSCFYKINVTYTGQQP